MRYIITLFFSLCLVTGVERVFAQTETPDTTGSWFQAEIDAANVWYESTGLNFQFGDYLQQRNVGQCIIGQDLMDNTLLTDLLTNHGIVQEHIVYNVLDSSLFVGDSSGYLYNAYRQFVCEKKICSSIEIDGDSYTNVGLYRIHEIDSFWAYGTLLDIPLVYNNYYYAIADSGTHIISSLVYWKDRTGIGMSDQKIIQNSRSTMLRMAKTASLQMVLSPVPASNEISIALRPEINNTVISLTVTDMNGKIMQNKSYANVTHDEGLVTNFDISNLAPGVYLIRAQGSSMNAMRRFTIVR